MPSYLVETYLTRGRTDERSTSERRARTAAAELTQGSRLVRFDHSIHVPEDEICFFVFAATSSEEAARAADLAALDPVRVVEAVTSGEE